MNLENKLAIISITEKGASLAEKIAGKIKADLYLPAHLLEEFTISSKTKIISFDYPLPGTVKEIFSNYKKIVFIMALGIVVRQIAPLIKNKHIDPAVVTIDESANFAISTLSGHEGGANNLAKEIANIIGAQPVITTASDVNRKAVIGIGCRKNIKKELVKEAIFTGLRETGLTLNNLSSAATIDKKSKENGLIDACKELGLPLKIFSVSDIKSVTGSLKSSKFVLDKIGVGAVSEPCAILASKHGRIVLPKQTPVKGITISIAEAGR